MTTPVRVRLIKYAGISQLERNLGTTPNPPDWYVWRIFLDTYPANLGGFMFIVLKPFPKVHCNFFRRDLIIFV